MKTKMTKELFKELGWIHNKDTKAYMYPDKDTQHAWIQEEFINKFTLKTVVKCMMMETIYRNNKSIIASINFKHTDIGDKI